MRIISGKYRGTKLKTVKSENTRPTTDKVKESLFNTLGQIFYGGKALDLFAGSGALGLESLSRGIDYVIFSDKSLEANKVIKENIERLKLGEVSEVICADAFNTLKILGKNKEKFDIIFLDPPYFQNLYERLLKDIYKYNLIELDGIVTVEHDKSIEIETYGVFDKIKTKIYGNIAITILKRSSVK